MSRMATHAIVLAATLLCLPAAGLTQPAVPEHRAWLEVRSPNFIVMGDAGAGRLRDVAERMEQLHATLQMMATRGEIRSTTTFVLVFRDERSFRPYMPIFNGKVVPVGGYFQPGLVNVITVLGREDDLGRIAYHEYVHQATAPLMGEAPIWLREGLAEFFSTFEVTSGGRTARLGRVQDAHVITLQREFLPLATLAAVDRNSPRYNEQSKSSVFYAESWALVHFLQLGEQRKYAPRVGAFMDALAEGAPFERACQEHLGTSVAALESELRNYLHSLVFYRLDSKLPDEVGRLERIEATPVSEGDVCATLGYLLHISGRARTGHGRTRRTPRQPTRPNALGLAVLAEQAQASRFGEAADLARRSAASSRQSFLSAYFQASAQMHEGEPPPTRPPSSAACASRSRSTRASPSRWPSSHSTWPMTVASRKPSRCRPGRCR
ncbi:MAG: DUF1570 domain-containing protein [Vicinamibacterales bacterium]